ncbi:MAG: hypothetical protein PHZ07_01160 [Patescibacteria group bacterium]|nr:hypothetical protein [Patescibacteria group bacterium]MDD4303954.1 hypothetical protein [Patescibacteria group bacterium]MDD4695057.1 hypothetical protein [Patescibacteria group bacterium]
MKKNITKYLLTLIITIFVFNIILTPISHAVTGVSGSDTTSAQIMKNLQTTAVTSAGYKQGDVVSTIAIIVRIVLSLLGVFFLILIIMGGFQWMSAGGNEETVTKARKRITDASIGLAIIIFSYLISMFIMGFFYSATI